MPLSTRDSAISEHTTKHSYPYRLHEPIEPSDQDKLSTATTTTTYRQPPNGPALPHRCKTRAQSDIGGVAPMSRHIARRKWSVGGG